MPAECASEYAIFDGADGGARRIPKYVSVVFPRVKDYRPWAPVALRHGGFQARVRMGGRGYGDRCGDQAAFPVGGGVSSVTGSGCGGSAPTLGVWVLSCGYWRIVASPCSCWQGGLVISYRRATMDMWGPRGGGDSFPAPWVGGASVYWWCRGAATDSLVGGCGRR